MLYKVAWGVSGGENWYGWDSIEVWHLRPCRGYFPVLLFWLPRSVFYLRAPWVVPGARAAWIRGACEMRIGEDFGDVFFVSMRAVYPIFLKIRWIFQGLILWFCLFLG